MKNKKQGNECDVIDFRKPKHYKDKEWLKLEEKQESCKKRIKKWCSADGSCDEVKNKNLYIDGEKVYKWKGWGMGRGTTYYESGKGKYKKSLGFLDDVRLNAKIERLKPFKIPDRTKFYRRKRR